MGRMTPNVYQGWEPKVGQIFDVYQIDENHCVKLASLPLEDYVLDWWHKTIMDIGLNKRLIVVSWNDLKQYCMCVRFIPIGRKSC